jgi:hypothetical protein
MITHDDLRRTIARHIEEARRMVTEQKDRIARLKATGVDTALAELTLRALEANLKRNRHATIFSRQPAFGSPDGVDARTSRVHQKATEDRPQHRTARRTATPTRATLTPDLTCQNHCAAVLVLRRQTSL